jgi:hypothetical protein
MRRIAGWRTEMNQSTNLGLRQIRIFIKVSPHDGKVRRERPELVKLLLGHQISRAEHVLHLVGDEHALKLLRDSRRSMRDVRIANDQDQLPD